MAEKSLSLMQQLALMPDAIPDCIVDFLEDFQQTDSSLVKEAVLHSLTKDLASTALVQLKPLLDTQRAGIGRLMNVKVMPVEGAPRKFLCHLQFPGSTRGLGFVLHPSEDKISFVSVWSQEYLEADLLATIKDK